MLRRIVAAVTALVLVAEAAVLVLVHLVLGRTTANQSMSIAGSDPDTMAAATYALGAGTGAFLLLTAVLAAVAAVRDRIPGRFARVVLVAAAVTHGVLGMLAVALVGWGAFAVMMLILCLLVLVLVLYPAAPAPAPAPAPASASGERELKPTSP